MSRIILHSDCNSFYASVECFLHPELRDKPVAVCGDPESRHGIILAKNELAKCFGVSTGEPIWQAQKKCPGLVTVKAQFDHYIDFSKRVRDIYSDYTDMIEPFGLDEAWLDITGSTKLFGNGVNIASEIKQRIKSEIGITVSIGISYNKIFAKLGSDYKKPDAITVISPHNYKRIVWPLPCEDLFYVGKATKRKMNSMGIYTIGDIANSDKEILKHNFGKWGERLYIFANGMDMSAVAPYGYTPPPKSIGNSTTAPRDLKSLDDVKIIFNVLADSVCRRMREQNLRCKTVCIDIRDNTLMHITRQKNLNKSTNLTQDIYRTCVELFKENYKSRKPIRSLSVNVTELENDTQGIQLSIFENDEEQRIRLESLNKALDEIKNRFGTFSLAPAVLLKDKRLSGFDPKEDNIIHPVGFRSG